MADDDAGAEDGAPPPPPPPQPAIAFTTLDDMVVASKEQLGGLFVKPKLSSKLLKRPPFSYLRAITVRPSVAACADAATPDADADADAMPATAAANAAAHHATATDPAPRHRHHPPTTDHRPHHHSPPTAIDRRRCQAAAIESTGVATSLFSAEELGIDAASAGPDAPPPDKAAKVRFLVKLISWLRFASGERLDVFVSPAK